MCLCLYVRWCGCAYVMLLRYVWDTKIPFCYDDDAQKIVKKYIHWRTHTYTLSDMEMAREKSNSKYRTGITQYQPFYFKFFFCVSVCVLPWFCTMNAYTHDESIDKTKRTYVHFNDFFFHSYVLPMQTIISLHNSYLYVVWVCWHARFAIEYYDQANSIGEKNDD